MPSTCTVGRASVETVSGTPAVGEVSAEAGEAAKRPAVTTSAAVTAERARRGARKVVATGKPSCSGKHGARVCAVLRVNREPWGTSQSPMWGTEGAGGASARSGPGERDDRVVHGGEHGQAHLVAAVLGHVEDIGAGDGRVGADLGRRGRGDALLVELDRRCLVGAVVGVDGDVLE